MSDQPVKQHEWEKVWVITEWNEGIVDYETGERDADPIEWECWTMYSEAVYDRDIKALEDDRDEWKRTCEEWVERDRKADRTITRLEKMLNECSGPAIDAALEDTYE